MKTKILLSFAILCCGVITTNAQINEGRYLLGGSFSTYSVTNQNSNSLYGSLQLGKVIKENTVIGIIGYVSSQKSTGYSSTGSPDYQADQYSAGVFYRKYKPLANKFYFFGEIDAAYQYGKNVQTYYSSVKQTQTTKSNGASIGFVPGISYSVFKRMQMELTMPNIVNISYAHSETTDSGVPSTVAPQKRNSFSANANLNSNLLSNFGIGFKFLLGK